VVIGLAAVAPAYRSLAATLAFVVLAVGEKAPSMFLLAFIPMLLLAFAYKELSQDTPDCGTTFTWDTKAFGPWIGWIGGWGLAVSAIIVLANVAEVAAGYLFKFLNLPTRWPRSAWPSRSTTASPPMRACAISGAACSPARNLFMRGIFPLLGAIAMTWAFVQSAIDMMAPDYGYTAFARSAACPSSASACWRSASP